MDNFVAMESSRGSDDSAPSCISESVFDSIKGSENPGDDLLEGLESYMEDIHERLTISRMVSDSVIKGIVNAVEQEAADKIFVKEMEVVQLKKALRLYNPGEDKIEPYSASRTYDEPKSMKSGVYASFSGALSEHDKMLGTLKVAFGEQFKKLKKEIEGIRGCSSIRRMDSEKCVDVDRMLEALETTIDTVFKRLNAMVYFSKESLGEWQKEREFQGEVEAMVIHSSINGFREEVEKKLWDQNFHFYDGESIKWLEKINELSSLRQELEVISKSLSIREGSYDSDRRGLRDHMPLSIPVVEGNGKLDHLNTINPENLEPTQLKHMSRDELFNHLKSQMVKMKREHESVVQSMTEENFILKRELLKRDSSSPLKKDKEFEILKKKLSEVILKLDDILVENEKLTSLYNNIKSLARLKESLDTLLTEKKNEFKCLSSEVSIAASLKARVDTLVQENRKLKDLLTDKNDEIECLSAAEADWLQVIGNLKRATEDTLLEASVMEEVYKCVLREVIDKFKCDKEESFMESCMLDEIYKIIFGEAVFRNGEATISWGIEDSDMETLIAEGLREIILGEAIKDAADKLSYLETKLIAEKEMRVFFEEKLLEGERVLVSEMEEKERLNHDLIVLSSSFEETGKLVSELEKLLAEERDRYDVAFQELMNLRNWANQQQISFSENSVELDLVKGELVEALGQIDRYEVELSKLYDKLDHVTDELKVSDEERRILGDVVQEKTNSLISLEAKEREYQKQLESIILVVQGFSKAFVNFESKVTRDIEMNNFRLEDSSSNLKPIIRKVNILRRTGLVWKQRLDKRQTDLKKAEDEVDLLGDEVEALLSLLEKIYIALDHYSPILKHYPGIMEILKLVRRGLNGEYTKPVDHPSNA